MSTLRNRLGCAFLGSWTSAQPDPRTGLIAGKTSSPARQGPARLTLPGTRSVEPECLCPYAWPGVRQRKGETEAALWHCRAPAQRSIPPHPALQSVPGRSPGRPASPWGSRDTAGCVSR